MRQQNIKSSLQLPDKTLQFVKDHPLLEDPVLPINNRPQLITKDVNYTQIVVERVQALDGNTYDVIFTGTGDGTSVKMMHANGSISNLHYWSTLCVQTVPVLSFIIYNLN